MANALRPSTVTDEHVAYLNSLRQTVNVFGTVGHIARRFNLSDQAARSIVVYYVESISGLTHAEAVVVVAGTPQEWE